VFAWLSEIARAFSAVMQRDIIKEEKKEKRLELTKTDEKESTY